MNFSADDLESWLRLTLIPGLGNATLRKLLREFESPEHILAASRSALTKIVPGNLAGQICANSSSEAVRVSLQWARQDGNHIVTLADSEYPALLIETPDPPVLLYVKGRIALLNHSSIAIVGSRNATAQGAANAEDFARTLSDSGLTVISGLALGIDAAAHRGGLAGASSTIAVVGTGLDIVYPGRNRRLAHEIAERGALISEFPLGTAALAANFPRRNRIISGMSKGCLVVEAALQSGSLITARLATEQGREVFALPGSIHSPLAKGCHKLIKQGAKLVDSVNDVLEEFSIGAVTAAAQSTNLDSDLTHALDQLGYEPTSLDAFCSRSGLAADAASPLLLKLELEGLLEQLPGGLFQRIRR